MLSMKDALKRAVLRGDALAKTMEDLHIGSTHIGVVFKINEAGCFVRVLGGAVGFVPKSVRCCSLGCNEVLRCSSLAYLYVYRNFFVF